MKDTLISQYNIILKNSLLNLGFSNKELINFVSRKILQPESKNSYLVLKKEKLQLIILKKLLNFDRKVLTFDELEFLNIDPINKKRLFAYGIAKRIDSNRFFVNGDINKLKLHRPEIDIVLYKELYKENLSNNNYIFAKKYLEKYIQICEAFNIEGDYYYNLTRINNDIEKQKLDENNFSLYRQLRKKYKNINVKKDPKTALTIAYDCYRLNKGSIEATMVAASQLALRKPDYNKIINFLYEAIEKDSTNPSIYKYLGKAYLKMEMYKEAKTATERYIALDKNCNYDGYADLFNLYLATNEIKLAHDLFERTLSIFSKKMSEKFISDCIKIIKNCVTKEINSNKCNLVRLTELNNLKSAVLKELSFSIDDFSQIERDNEKYSNIEQEVIALLKPDDNNMVDTNLVDSYILNLDVSQEDKNLILLRTSLVLARNNYFDKANNYVIEVERNKHKSNYVKQQLENARREIKLIKRKK